MTSLSHVKPLFALATPDDAAAIAALRTAAGERLTIEFGKGHWSGVTSEKGVLGTMRSGRVYVVREGETILGTFKLATKKPWAIDKSYFQDSAAPLYLTDMAVAPAKQRRGIGRRLLRDAARVARAWPADAIRLDAYDAPAGAGDFYARCGFHEVGRATYRGVPLIYYEQLL